LKDSPTFHDINRWSPPPACVTGTTKSAINNIAKRIQLCGQF
jgi:hypothetical protein